MRTLFTPLLCVVLLSGACARGPEPRIPPEAQHYADVTIANVPNAREWGDEARPEQVVVARRRLRERQIDRWRALGSPPEGLTLSLLALSGGGPDGAFGAGLLTGWTETGTRPPFDLVTGISVGALIAPFAFAGPEYDAVLRVIFTELGQDSVAEFAPIAALRGALGVADTSPLRRTISAMVDEALLREVALEHAKGRTLLIGTTNIDAGRPVVWNMGRIAEAGEIELFRDIMMASASIPGAFPPVEIAVQTPVGPAGEYHVDGGVTRSVFIAARGQELAIPDDLPFPLAVDVFVIQNNRLFPDFEPVRRSLPAIVSRSLSTLIRDQSRGDLLDLYLSTQQLGGDFHLTFVPGDIAAGSTVSFDTEYMTQLFELARQQALDGVDWFDVPPSLSTRSAFLGEEEPLAAAE